MKCCTTVEKEISKAGRSIPESEKQKLSYFLVCIKNIIFKDACNNNEIRIHYFFPDNFKGKLVFD